MEIEGFNEIASILTLAKELHDIGRFDIVEKQFFDTLCCDSWLENSYEVINRVFSGFNTAYDEDNEIVRMIFTDDVIGGYFCMASEYGRIQKVPHEENPFVKAAESEIRRWLNFTYNMDWKLLGYTKTKKAARKSMLIVDTCACEFYEHDHLAYGLLQLYKWFSDRCAEFKKPEEVIAA